MHIRRHCALRVVLFSALAAAAVPLSQAAEPAKSPETAKGSESGKTHTVTKLGIKMTVPESWKSINTNSNVHLMEFSIPKMEGDKDDTVADVLFYGSDMGGPNANFQRWIDQFDPKDRKIKMTTGKSPQGDYTLLDISGTWNRLVPTPEHGLKVVHTTGREIDIAVTPPHFGTYYYRLMGTEANVAANLDAFRAAVGADAKTEKEYKAPAKVTAQKPVVQKRAAQKPSTQTPAAAKTKPAETKPAATTPEPKK